MLTTGNSISPGPTLTPAAIARLRTVDEDDPVWLRVTIESGGCSGFKVGFSLAEGPEANESTFVADHGVAVLVHAETADLLTGTIIDWEESLAGGRFRLDHPQATAACGCGASFAL